MKSSVETSTRRSPKHSTEQQLINAAGQTFARLGFYGATVRNICTLAHANVAAINYHFGGKKQLYIATLRYACDSIISTQPLWFDPASAQMHAEERLRTFIHRLLLRQANRDRIPWFGKLILHEMMEPTGMLDELMEQYFRPEVVFLMNIVQDLLGSDRPHDRLRVQSCTMSILGQCLFCAGPGFRLITRYMDHADEHDIEQLTDHITRFSLTAIGQL